MKKMAAEWMKAFQLQELKGQVAQLKEDMATQLQAEKLSMSSDLEQVQSRVQVLACQNSGLLKEVNKLQQQLSEKQLSHATELQLSLSGKESEMEVLKKKYAEMLLQQSKKEREIQQMQESLNQKTKGLAYVESELKEQAERAKTLELQLLEKTKETEDMGQKCQA